MDRIGLAQPSAPDYGRQFLFPPALEDWVPADHPVRFLREFVEQLDLPALGFAMPSAAEGRPPYAPSLRLKIWLSGYFFRIRAPRRLEAACGEVLPLVWLCGLRAPDHNSLWRFWRDNKKALRAVFKQSVQLAVRTGCAGLALQARDGTKIQAAASTATGWNKEYMEKLLAARQENDGGQLVPMLEQARENPGVAAAETLTVADTGYGAGPDRAAATEKEMQVLAVPAAGTPARDNPSAAPHCVYDAAAHTGTCPRGQQLDHEGATTKKGLRAERFRCHGRDCPVRGDCPRDPKGRQIEVWPHTAGVQAMRARRREPAAQARPRRRQEIIEPRFGQIQQHAGFRRWTVLGLDNVRTQWALLCTTLNLRIMYRRGRAGPGPHGPSAAAAALKKVAAGLEKVRAGAGAGAVWRRARTWRRHPEARTAAHGGGPLAPSVLRLANYF